MTLWYPPPVFAISASGGLWILRLFCKDKEKKLWDQSSWMNQWLTSELWQRGRRRPDELKKGVLVLQCLLRVLGFLLVKRHQSSGFHWDSITMLTASSFNKKGWETHSYPGESHCCTVFCLTQIRHCWVKTLWCAVIYNALKFDSCFLDYAVVRF